MCVQAPVHRVHICTHLCIAHTCACVLGTPGESRAKASGSSNFARALGTEEVCCILAVAHLESSITLHCTGSSRGLLGAVTLPTHP